MSLFKEKFDELTQNRFDYLKITSVDVLVRNATVTVNFIYPENRQKEVLDNAGQISSVTERILNSAAKTEVKLKMSHFDKSFFIGNFLDFLKKYPSIISDIEDGDIEVCETDGQYKISVSLHSHILDYCNEKNVLADIKEYLDINFCEFIDAGLKLKKDENFEIKIDYEPDAVKTKLDDESGRFIVAQNVEEFVGQIIYDKAVYIEDAVKPKERLVVCGTLTQINEYSRKPKEGEKEEKKFYRMTIEDITGHIDFLYFPTKNTKDQITLLKAGKEIITRGALEVDKRDETKLVYIVKDISLCTLPKDIKVNRIRRIVEKEYLKVFPKSYNPLIQVSLFDTAANFLSSAQYLKGKSFVVFDLETTGLNPAQDRIIEIAAVKIIDGKFTETFSTFVDPKIPIPERITDLTGITDLDVANMPAAEDVLIDFYKFSEGSALVAQNIQFDYSFIAAAGKPLNIYFENQRYDTLLLARKYIPKMHNYKLETIAERLGVELNNAHRAISDAFATAHIFLKLAQNM